MKLPTNAIIAVTLNCNSHCQMCDIWQKPSRGELTPTDFLKLPRSLRDINITGGEPFLREDLDQIVKNIKKVCPQTRLIINTNGLAPEKIEKSMISIIKTDPQVAVRVSLDGKEQTHNKIRRVKDAFSKALNSLAILKKIGVHDLGISFTIMEDNYRELWTIYQFSQKKNIELSLTLVSNSPIYFGENKKNLRPKNPIVFVKEINKIIKNRYQNLKPKEWFRAWFDQGLINYSQAGQRPLPCTAGDSFFYLDSHGNIYTCHLKPWLLGNIRDNSFEDIWQAKSSLFQSKVRNCQDCWMICSAKTAMQQNLPKICCDIVKQKIKHL